MLAKEWREHKQIAQENKTSNEDNIYNKYKVRYEKINFLEFRFQVLLVPSIQDP